MNDSAPMHGSTRGPNDEAGGLGIGRDGRLEAALAEARAFVAGQPAPDVTPAVMAAIAGVEAAEPAAPILARIRRALWAPRTVTIRFRPAYGAIAAAVAVAALSAGASLPRPWAPPAAIDAPDRTFLVQFRLEVPHAADVRLAGTFSGWEPRHQLDETAPGIWTIMLPLPDGVHDYAFVVDGEHWLPDPHAPHVSDGFGGTNSRLALLAPVAEPSS